MSAGRLITIEGLEGAGKTTCVGFVEQLLRQRGLDPVLTREPGGTPLGEAVRGLLLGQEYQGMSARTEALLMFAARAEHLDKVVLPALQAGRWVLCDRFTEASYAYQGGGRQLGSEAIAALERWLQGELRPDLTLLLDLPVEQGLERAARRGALDRIEQEQRDFFTRAQAVYRELAQRYPERIRLIDAARPLPEVQQAVAAALATLLEAAGG